MLVLRDPTDTYLIADPGIRKLVEQRFAEVFSEEPYDANQHGYMIVVESGDSVETLEKESGCAILYETFDDVPFGHPDFTPSFEALEDHHDCYEMLFISNDNGFGITLIVPRNKEGIDACLLAMCAQYAQPATVVDEA
jgi:hypothetical protein